MRARGFTLLELLTVLVIAGLALGFVSVNVLPSDRRVLQDEAQRIALLLQLARDEAIVRNRPIAFEAGSERYRFLIREGSNWQLLSDDDMLHEREFKRAPMSLSITPAVAAETNPLRIVFGREPVDKPFVLTMSVGDTSVALRADGIGHFVVE
ncbi:type II secretion system protein GspH [Noviherbaspirillum cavernae]|uniref:Type II secretion system protein H n=1 Tax=Noviherbaspirillum cavernae TaxID=2320862 RepID=A0A418X5Q4_9BURK|nr:type II secretion system protein GspH [Noviherbaspirillum cavernae]